MSMETDRLECAQFSDGVSTGSRAGQGVSQPRPQGMRKVSQKNNQVRALGLLKKENQRSKMVSLMLKPMTPPLGLLPDLTALSETES